MQHPKRCFNDINILLKLHYLIVLKSCYNNHNLIFKNLPSYVYN